MYTYWAFVRTVVGGFMRVTVQADNPYNAYQMLRAMYGRIRSETMTARGSLTFIIMRFMQ